MAVAFEGARLVDARGEVARGRLDVDGGRLVDPSIAASTFDARGLTILPGFVEVHTHGGGGFALQTRDPDEVRRYAAWAPSTGCTAFLAAVVGVPHGLPEAELSAVATAAASPGPGAELLGVHLEGPFLNPVRRGAHPAAWLRTPSEVDVERLLAASRGWLRIVTLAPELPGASAAIRRFIAAGVTVSVGHTDASYEQTRAAIALGVRQVTHCFNAMSPLLHRAPGPLGAVLEEPTVLGELIADGVHVHPAAMRALVRLLGSERVVVVTDAQSGAGLDDPVMSFGGQEARVVGGVARLLDGTIAGSVLTMDRALRNLVDMLELDLPTTSAMLSWNPARAAGVSDRKGLLAPGFDADLALIDDNLRLVATYCRGRLAFARPDWLPRLRTAGFDGADG